jgi:hypothetical protein
MKVADRRLRVKRPRSGDTVSSQVATPGDAGFARLVPLEHVHRLTDQGPGRAALDAMIAQQAQIIAYIDDYKLLMIATLALVPLLVVFKRSTHAGGHAAVEL